MQSRPIMKVDAAVRIVTLLLLLLATTGAQIFVMPTFEAIYARDGLTFPVIGRLAIDTLLFLGHPLVMLAIAAGLAVMVRKRLGDAQQRLAGVAVATLVLALVLIGQASLLIDLAIRRVTVGPG